MQTKELTVWVPEDLSETDVLNIILQYGCDNDSMLTQPEEIHRYTKKIKISIKVDNIV